MTRITVACLDMAGTTVADDGAVEEAFWRALKAVGLSSGQLMDDPEQTKAGLRGAYGRLLELDFDLLLLAHGDPVVSGGNAALRAFVGDPQ